MSAQLALLITRSVPSTEYLPLEPTLAPSASLQMTE